MVYGPIDHFHSFCFYELYQSGNCENAISLLHQLFIDPGFCFIYHHLGPVHTYPDIFENASFFIRFQKDSRPHEERFRKYPRPHGNAVTLTIRYSIMKFRNR